VSDVPVMAFIDRGMLLGIGILLLDFAAWRFLRFNDQRIRFFVRLLLFAALSYVLWSTGLIPLSPAPRPDDAPRHVCAQVLELLWWFQAAQVASVIVSRVILPGTAGGAHLFQDVLRALVFLTTAVAGIALVLKLPIGGLLATSGALAIIFGLAVQSTLSDVFSGVVLTATQPFRLDEIVTIGDIEGSVVESNWRATTLLNSQGNFVVVPNSVAAKSNIVNHSRPPQMHGMTVLVRASPAVRPSIVIDALQSAVLGTMGVLDTPQARVSARGVHYKYIEYEILVYVASAEMKSSIRNEVIDQVYRHLDAHGITLGQVLTATPSERSPTQLLRGVDLFRTLDEHQLEGLASDLVAQSFEPGQVIYHVEAKCPDEKRALLIVASGVASLLVPHDGRDIQVRRLGPGEAIGRAGILTGISTGIKLQAVGRVTILLLHKESLTPMLQAHPEIANTMLTSLMDYEAKAASVLGELPRRPADSDSIFHRLLEGMRRMHRISH
jgi:small-conductance mechanosensitive channel/CRP-like cAMP-binding protein